MKPLTPNEVADKIASVITTHGERWDGRAGMDVPDLCRAGGWMREQLTRALAFLRASGVSGATTERGTVVCVPPQMRNADPRRDVFAAGVWVARVEIARRRG